MIKNTFFWTFLKWVFSFIMLIISYLNQGYPIITKILTISFHCTVCVVFHFRSSTKRFPIYEYISFPHYSIRTKWTWQLALHYSYPVGAHSQYLSGVAGAVLLTASLLALSIIHATLQKNMWNGATPKRWELGGW